MSESAVYTHGHHESVLRSHKWRTVANSAAYLQPLLRPDMHILDVGCGPGTITVDFATYVPQGHVTGIDFSSHPFPDGRAAAAARGVTNVLFEQADATALPYADDTFDVVHAHQVLQHVGDPVRVLQEMRRVTKPGGIVATREADFGGMVWYPEVDGMQDWRATYMRVARHNGGEPDAGRRLHAWAKKAGFDGANITCTAGTWCYTSPEEKKWWSEMSTLR